MSDDDDLEERLVEIRRERSENLTLLGGIASSTRDPDILAAVTKLEAASRVQAMDAIVTARSNDHLRRQRDQLREIHELLVGISTGDDPVQALRFIAEMAWEWDHTPAGTHINRNDLLGHVKWGSGTVDRRVALIVALGKIRKKYGPLETPEDDD